MNHFAGANPRKLTVLGLALTPAIHGNAIQPSPPRARQLQPACVQVATTSEAFSAASAMSLMLTNVKNCEIYVCANLETQFCCL